MDIYTRIENYKKKYDEQRPLCEDTLEQIKGYYKIGLTWSSNALEGNTLTESETKVLLEDGLTVGGKPLREIYEAIGHGNAYDFLFSLQGKKTFSEDEILRMHRLFYASINENEAGCYRQQDVIITGSHYPTTPFSDIKRKMKAMVKWFNEERSRLNPIKAAAQLHLHFVYIHPFIDGNGRVARLLMNLTLLQEGYLPAIISPVLRHEYIALLEKAHTNKKPFEDFIAERVFESYCDMMRLFHIKF